MKIETRPIDSLVPDSRNARKHGKKNLATIKASLAQFGQRRAAVVRSDGTVLAGNGMLEAARSLGWTELSVTVVPDDWTDEEARAYALADNRTGELAEWDVAVLDEHLVELEVAGLDIEALGFETPKREDAEVEEDDVPETPDNPVSNPGDLWQLGNHRLMCGSCTDAGSVARLFNGEKAQMLFTSPPYALGGSVKLSGNRAMSKRQNAYDNHEDKSADWPRLMEEWWETNHPFVSDVHLVNVQMLAGNKRALVEWMHNRRERLVDVITWDKGHAAPAMASGVLTSRFEWIIVLGRVDAPRTIPLSSWRGNVSNVYAAGPQRSNEYSDKHAATMPIHLPVWAMTELCDKTESVYDPFMGTGTTLIAAESIGVRAYGMELSPAYCDVIIRRWETMTGETAVKVDG
jgi:DNA modification methylase